MRPSCKGILCRTTSSTQSAATGSGVASLAMLLTEGRDAATKPSRAKVKGHDNQTSCGGRGCDSFINGAACQCNHNCFDRKDCCFDFAKRCVLSREEFRTVGSEPTTDLLKLFWASAVSLFAIVASLLVWHSGSIDLTAIVQRIARAGVGAAVTHGSLSYGRADANGLAGFDGLDESDVGKLRDQADTADKDFATHSSFLDVRFRNPQVEAHFEAQATEARVKLGARILAFVIMLLLLLKVHFWHDTPVCRDFGFVAAWIIFASLAAIFCIAVYCHFRPSERLLASALVAMWCYLPASQLPPFSKSCWALKEVCKASLHLSAGLAEQYYRSDCSLQGQFAMQLFMTLIFILPWCAVRMSYMHAMWFWIAGVWAPLTMLYRYFMHEVVYSTSEVAYSAGLLCVALVMGTMSRRQHEVVKRARFVEDEKQRQYSRTLLHVIVVHDAAACDRAFASKSPQAHIADHVNCVSVLFVVIADFDTFTSSMTPSQLLRFLNDQFTLMDRVCEKHHVTKIETVGEEYVACVGVTPKDIELHEHHGHGFLLERLFNAAGAMLRCPADSVMLRMGIHTGPVVAGVIGTKLPRYRLFGDTMNMAARMMQRGAKGEVQFGVETRRHLPQVLREVARGPTEVEMKGKGRVQAYTYVPLVDELPDNAPTLADTGRASKRASLVAVLASSRSEVSMVGGSSVDSISEAALMESRINSTLEGVNGDEEGFSQDMEKDWRRQFHREVVCATMALSFGRFCILTTILTWFELMFLIENRVWRFPHRVYFRHSRWVVFLCARAIIIVIGMLWWIAADTQKWVKRRPRLTQSSLCMSGLIITTLMYLSYDAISFSHTDTYRKLSEEVVRAPNDRTLGLNFVVFFWVFMRMNQLPYQFTLLYLPLALAILSAPQWFHVLFPHLCRYGRPVYSLFSDEGGFLLLVQVCTNVAIARETEHGSRQRFKAQRSLKISEERTNYILGTLMPPLVMDEIRRDPLSALPSHLYRHATIAQSDLCGFTQLSSKKAPTEVVKFVGDLFGAFDQLTDKHGVYKVETVGDAYIAGMAEKPLTQHNSPVSVVIFGLDMVRAVDEWASELGVRVTCRVGVHYGECIGGIVGNDMQRYHLFGNFLTVLDVMESTSVEARVQVSSACKAEVDRQLKDDPRAAQEILAFVQRDEPHLQTSKGEIHHYADVGGRTYLTMSDHPLRRLGVIPLGRQDPDRLMLPHAGR
eukprot:CAMPEP_0170277562 /NCGR_PEP_ID=MMETSP0116_2-20130129/38774_1 /TAXON_ID=400756 /ORGANISM="Durinskia baltica, Strain CSIRO CS-38" /LENGTH=1208 /DNA_ID=CAMNT_0010528851 /DNA_START=100 /DNA_END=3725 /DNA_ORIENTATION=+